MDLLAGLFLFCFVFGLCFAFISFVAGHLVGLGGGDHGGLGGHEGDMAADHAVEAGHGGGGLRSFFGALHLGPSNASMFLAWFGGVGYATYAILGWAAVAGLSLAILAGVVGAALVTLFLVRVLLPGQTIMEHSQVLGEGTVARVSREIRPGGIGEIVYTLGGTRHSDGARSVDDSAIPYGAEVVVTRVDRGIAYVQPFGAYLASSKRQGGMQ